MFITFIRPTLFSRTKWCCPIETKQVFNKKQALVQCHLSCNTTCIRALGTRGKQLCPMFSKPIFNAVFISDSIFWFPMGPPDWFSPPVPLSRELPIILKDNSQNKLSDEHKGEHHTKTENQLKGLAIIILKNTQQTAQGTALKTTV